MMWKQSDAARRSCSGTSLIISCILSETRVIGMFHCRRATYMKIWHLITIYQKTSPLLLSTECSESRRRGRDRFDLRINIYKWQVLKINRAVRCRALNFHGINSLSCFIVYFSLSLRSKIYIALILSSMNKRQSRNEDWRTWEIGEGTEEQSSCHSTSTLHLDMKSTRFTQYKPERGSSERLRDSNGKQKKSATLCAFWLRLARSLKPVLMFDLQARSTPTMAGFSMKCKEKYRKLFSSQEIILHKKEERERT